MVEVGNLIWHTFIIATSSDSSRILNYSQERRVPLDKQGAEGAAWYNWASYGNNTREQQQRQQHHNQWQ
jgi:hypothetical protein